MPPTGRAVLLCATSCLLLRPAAAPAQQATKPSEEIVVTAEKRSSTIQKTAISITALKGSELARNGITTVAQVAQQVPGVSFKTGGPGQTELEMRGLNSGGGNSATVGFYLDDAPLSTFAYSTAGKVVIDPDLYDINRIEVLRGPQGTLYGSGSMGGTFRVLTNQPDATKTTGSLHLVGGGTQGGGLNGGFDAMLNVPIVQDKAALRVVASDRFLSGWIDRIVVDPFPLPIDNATVRGNVTGAPVASKKSDVNDEHLQSFRASLLLQPSDNLTITPGYFFQSVRQGGQSLVDVPPDTEAHYAPFAQSEPVHDSFFLVSLNIKYDLGWAGLTSATSYWHRGLSQVQDGSEVLQDVLLLPGYTVASGGIGNDPWIENDTASELSQELRLASTGSGPLSWIAGVFYSATASRTVEFSNDPAAAPVLGVAELFHEDVPQFFGQEAVFGEASYSILPTLKATAGVRLYNYNNAFTAVEYGFFGPYGTLQPGGSTSHEHDQGINPKFNLAWLPNPDLTVYATAAKGFRPGGGNETVPTSGTSEGNACAISLAALGKTSNPVTYGPDSLWSYELGEKARLFGDRVTLNADVYYEHWRAIQRAVTLTCGYIYTDNAGEANIFGGEVELSARLTDALTFNANFGYTDATYAQNNEETGVVKGEVLPDVARFSSTQSIVYAMPVADSINLTARATNSYVSSRQDVNYYVDRLPGYDTGSARLSLDFSGGWSAGLFVDNIGNSHAVLSAINSIVLNIPTLTRDTTLRPRTFGLDLTYKF
jgi:outer membrane receptor protein involved in Fe transport